MKKFILYLIRWQLSTPLLWLVVRQMGTSLQATIIANLIGGAIFYWVDKFIFTSQTIEMWHVKEDKCDKCGNTGHLWRLVVALGYDRRNAKPKFLCLSCSKKRTDELRKQGIKIKGRSK
jgi:hypothetical protein